MNTRGFTLIELLVVIAIIAILAAVSFALLGGGRTTARDTAVKAEMSQVLNMVEMYYENNNNYGAVLAEADCVGGAAGSIFATNAELAAILAKIQSENGGISPRCAAGATSGGIATSWAVKVVLPSAPSGAPWCVDSNQFRGQMAFSGSGGVNPVFSYVFTLAEAMAPPQTYPIYGGTVPATCKA